MATEHFESRDNISVIRAVSPDSAATVTSADLIATSRHALYNTTSDVSEVAALAATTSVAPAQTSSNGFPITAGQLVGIVIGGSLIVLGIPLGVYFWMYKRRQRLRRQQIVSSIQVVTAGPRMSVSSSIAPSLSPTLDGPSRQNTFRSVLSSDHLTVIHEMEGERALVSDRRIIDN